MQKSNFTVAKNEATVKLYTDVSKIVWASCPNYFTQELCSGSHYPILKLTQFNLHTHIS